MPNHIIEGDSRLTDSRAPNGAAGGDLTGSYPSPSVAAGAITNTKAADMANGTIKGRSTAGTGDPEDLTGAQATALLSAMGGDAGSGGTKGLAPAPAAGDTAAGKFLKASGAWAVPGMDIDGLTAETAPLIGDTVPIYDASASANRKVTLGVFRALMAEHIAQVRLIYTGATDLALAPCGGSLIEVNGEIVDVGASLYLLNTDNLISSTGANVGSAPAANTLYYAYVSNSQASYAPGDLRLSATAPTGIHGGLALGTDPKGDDYYLGTSGNARHWRFVGMVQTVGSSQFADTETQRLVASYYNRRARHLFTCPAYADGNSTSSFTFTSTTWARMNGGTGDKVEWLSFGDEAVWFHAQMYSNNTGTYSDLVGIAFDSTTNTRVAGSSYPANNVAVTNPVGYRYTPTPGYHYAHLMALTTGGTMTIYVDLVRSGATADPFVTYLTGAVLC